MLMLMLSLIHLPSARHSFCNALMHDRDRVQLLQQNSLEIFGVLRYGCRVHWPLGSQLDQFHLFTRKLRDAQNVRSVHQQESLHQALRIRVRQGPQLIHPHRHAANIHHSSRSGLVRYSDMAISRWWWWRCLRCDC